MSTNKYPPGWDEERVRRVLDHYESQTDEEALAEDEAVYEATTHTTMSVGTLSDGLRVTVFDGFIE